MNTQKTSARPLRNSRGIATSGLVFGVCAVAAAMLLAFGWYRELQQGRSLAETLAQTSSELASVKAAHSDLVNENNTLKTRLSTADENVNQLSERVWSVTWLAFNLTLESSSQSVASSHSTTTNLSTKVNMYAQDGTSYEFFSRDTQCDYEEVPPSSRRFRCEFVPREGTSKLLDVRRIDTIQSIAFANPPAFSRAGLPFDVFSARLCVFASINSSKLDLGCAEPTSGPSGPYFNARELFATVSGRYFDALKSGS